MKIDRELLLEDLEKIQERIESMGFKGINEYDLHLRETIADYIIKNEIPKILKHCPNCTTTLKYCDVLGVYQCQECEHQEV